MSIATVPLICFKVDISVVIPTYNRADILRQCLECLEQQTLSTDRFEVIIVNDGSTDDTKSVVEFFSVSSQLQIQYEYQVNKGQGVARNVGVRVAKGKLIVLIGDDILIGDSFLEEHLNVHETYTDENVACLGFIEWHPSLLVTDYMKWLTNGSAVFGKFGGHQFAYEKLKGQQWADWNFFYTSNLSIKKSLLLKHQFDLSFSSYGWEDIELGYRMHKESGLRVRYNPKAIGYHLHELSEETLGARMKKIGESAWVFHFHHPELSKIPRFWKRLIFSLLSHRLSLFCLRMFGSRFKHVYYYALSKKYFLEGVDKGKQGLVSFLSRGVHASIDDVVTL